MSSGVEQLDAGRFILRYEHPFGGVATDASPEDIAPSQFPVCDGLLIRNGKLCSTNYYVFDPTQFKFGVDGTKTYWDKAAGTADIVAIYTTGSLVVAIDYNCNTYKYDFTNLKWVPDQTPAITPPTPQPQYSCSQMIKGVIYIFDWFNGNQWVYTPLQSIVPGTWFVGGKYCMALDRYLITANTNQNGYTYIDGNGNPVTVDATIRADGYSWSVPSHYTQFGPITADPILDPNQSAGRQTGQNYIAEVQNEITGCFAMGNVGYILHDTGITQLTPTGVDTTPFALSLLWGGKDGAGCTMPTSFAIYGYVAVWGNNSGFYIFSSGAAPQEITGSARVAIFDDINRFKHSDIGNNISWLNIHGQICNCGVDDNDPELVYNLYIVYTSPPFQPPIQLIVWTYVFRTSTWTRHLVNITDLMKNISGNANYTFRNVPTSVVAQTFKFPLILDGYGDDTYISPLYGGLIFNVWPAGQGNWPAFMLFQYINQNGVQNVAEAPPYTNLTFRTEEFQIYRQPTVRGVIIRAQGLGDLSIFVGNTQFTNIHVNSIGVTTLYRSFGVHTSQAPNVNIVSSNFNGFITKVHAFGTYAEGEPI